MADVPAHPDLMCFSSPDPWALHQLARRYRIAPQASYEEALFGASQPRQISVDGFLPLPCEPIVAKLLGMTEGALQACLLASYPEPDDPAAPVGLDGIRAALEGIEDPGSIVPDWPPGIPPADLVLTTIPVPPRSPALPPFGPPIPDDAGWTLVAVMQAQARIKRLRELNAPSSLLHNEAMLLRDAVTSFLRTASADVPCREASVHLYDVEQRRYRAAEPRDLRPTAPSLRGACSRDRRPDPEVPEDVLWADEHVLLVYPWAIVHLSAGGQVRNLVPMSSRQVAGVSADGRYVWLAPHEPVPRSHVYDLFEGRFVVGFWPEGIVGRAFAAGPEHSGTSLVDFRRARTVRFPAASMLQDRVLSPPTGKVQYSPEGDLAWPCVTPGSDVVGIIDTVAARPIARLATGRVDSATLHRPGVSGTRCRALVRIHQNALRLFYRGRIIDNGKEVSKVPAPKGSCVSFARGGRGLVFATRDRLDLVDLDRQGARRSTRSLDLRPLHPELALPWDHQLGLVAFSAGAVEEADGATMHDVMRSFGTVEAVRNASPEELLDRVTSSYREGFAGVPSWDLESARLLLACLEDLPRAPEHLPTLAR
jgi:hypothetical protein